jgi:hypothetical protein
MAALAAELAAALAARPFTNERLENFSNIDLS